MKRGREDVNNNCLVQISKRPLWRSETSSVETKTRYCNNVADQRMFECKTCGRVFTSFQALGGHRASHHHHKKKLKMDEEKYMKISEVVKVVKTVHECLKCGIKFPIGQALGGHMRRHRVVVDDDDKVRREVVLVMSGDDDVKKMVPILMRSLSKNRRVMCMDLNLTPLENDLKMLFGKKAPKVDGKLVV